MRAYDKSLEINNGYKLYDIATVKQSDNHIPYIAAIILEGPRGGKYSIDSHSFSKISKEFGLKCCGYSIYNITIVNNTGDEMNYTPIVDKTDGKTMEETAKLYGKKHYNATYIKRDKANDFINKIKS